LWHSGRIGNTTKVVLDDCLGELVVKKVKGIMGSMVGAKVATTLYD
jgi:hypothetical protein